MTELYKVITSTQERDVIIKSSSSYSFNIGWHTQPNREFSKTSRNVVWRWNNV